MSYRDTWAVCTKCGRRFIFRVEEQRLLAREGKEITPPLLCPACRPRRTATGRSERRRRPEPRIDQKSLGPGPYEGTVKWYDDEKGYGFIIHPGGYEIFFHRSGIAPGELPDFPDGTPVTYCLEQTDKGPQAVDVERMGG